jgi:tape measure domain-containing protein
MSLSLGTLEIGLGLNTAQYDSGIKSAKDQLSSLERRVTKLGTTPLKIKVSVDDRQLYGLNSHLLLKRVDLKKTVDFYKANPIKVFAEDDALVSLNQELRELKKTSVEIRTPSKIVVEHRFSGYQDRVEKAIERLSATVRNSNPRENIFQKAFNLTVGNVVGGFFTGAGLYGGLKAGKGINKTIGIDFESQGEAIGKTVRRNVRQFNNLLDAAFRDLLGFPKGLKSAKQLLRINYRTITDTLFDPETYRKLEDIFVEAQQFSRANAKKRPKNSTEPEPVYPVGDKLREAFPKIAMVAEENLARSLGAAARVAVQPLRIRKRIQLSESAMAAKEIAKILQLSQKEQDFIKSRKSITLVTGGVQPSESRPGKPEVQSTYDLAAQIQGVFPETAVLAVPNVLSNSLEELRNSPSQFIREQLLPIIEKNKELLRQFISETDYQGILSGFKTVQPIDRVFQTNSEGFDKDAITLAAKALNVAMGNPEKEIALVGGSGGGYVVEEAVAILQQLIKMSPALREVLKNVKYGLGIGTPNAGLTSVVDPKSPLKYIAAMGNYDKVGITMFGKSFIPDIASKDPEKKKKAEDIYETADVALPSRIFFPSKQQLTLDRIGEDHKIGLYVANLATSSKQFNKRLKESLKYFYTPIVKRITELKKYKEKLERSVSGVDQSKLSADDTKKLDELLALISEIDQEIADRTEFLKAIPVLGNPSKTAGAEQKELQGTISAYQNTLAEILNATNASFSYLDPLLSNLEELERLVNSGTDTIDLKPSNFGSLLRFWMETRKNIFRVMGDKFEAEWTNFINAIDNLVEAGYEKQFRAKPYHHVTEADNALPDSATYGETFSRREDAPTDIRKDVIPRFGDILYKLSQTTNQNALGLPLVKDQSLPDLLKWVNKMPTNTEADKAAKKVIEALIEIRRKEARFYQDFLRRVSELQKRIAGGDTGAQSEYIQLLKTSPFSRIREMIDGAGKYIDVNAPVPTFIGKNRVIKEIATMDESVENITDFFFNLSNAILGFEATLRTNTGLIETALENVSQSLTSASQNVKSIQYQPFDLINVNQALQKSQKILPENLDVLKAEKIGQGFTGAVYRLGDLAIKTPITELNQGKLGTPKEFQSQLAMAKRGLAPRPITTRKGEYFIQEYIKSVGSLNDVLRKADLSTQEGIKAFTDYIKRYAALLKNIHEAGYAHFDLNTENVLITPENELKAIDFANATKLSKDDAERQSQINRDIQWAQGRSTRGYDKETVEIFQKAFDEGYADTSLTVNDPRFLQRGRQNPRIDIGAGVVNPLGRSGRSSENFPRTEVAKQIDKKEPTEKSLTERINDVLSSNPIAGHKLKDVADKQKDLTRKESSIEKTIHSATKEITSSLSRIEKAILARYASPLIDPWQNNIPDLWAKSNAELMRSFVDAINKVFSQKLLPPAPDGFGNSGTDRGSSPLEKVLEDISIKAQAGLKSALTTRLSTPDSSGEIQLLTGQENISEMLNQVLIREFKEAGRLLGNALKNTSLDVIKFGQVVFTVLKALERPVMALPGAAIGKKAIQVGGTAAMGAATLHALPMGLDATVVNTMRDILAGAMSAGGREMIQSVATQMTQAFSGLPFGVGQQLTEAVVQLVTEITNGTISVLSQGGAVAGSALMAGEGVKRLLGASTSNVPKLVSKEEQQKIEGKTQKALKAAKNKADSLITTEITPYFDERVFPASNPIPANIKAINPEYYTVKQLRGLARNQGIDVPASGAGARKEEIWKSLTEKFNPDQLTRLLLTTKASDRTKLGKKELSGFQVETRKISDDFIKTIGGGIQSITQQINTNKDIQSLKTLFSQLEKIKTGIASIRANPEFDTTSINKSLIGFVTLIDNLLLNAKSQIQSKNILLPASTSNLQAQNIPLPVTETPNPLKRVPQENSPTSPGWVGKLPISDLNLDPERFQYKLVHGKTGSTGSLSGVGKWDDDLAGVVSVWRDPKDGKVYVVNGHNRLNLAKDLNVKDITVRLLNAQSAQEARAKGAMINIAEGRGTAIDAAKFLRDMNLADKESLKKAGIPMRDRVASQGLALAQLPQELFDRVASGDIPGLRGVQIGGSGLKEFQQRELVKLIENFEKKGKKVTESVVSELIDTLNASTVDTVEQFDLFGLSTTQQTDTLTRAEVQSALRNRIVTDKQIFGSLTSDKKAAKLQTAGNQINIEENKAIADQAEQALRVFDQLKNTASPVSSIINEAIALVKEQGMTAKAATDAVYDKLKQIVPQLAKGGLESGKNLNEGLEKGLKDTSASNIAYQNAIKIVDQIDKGLGNASPSWKGKEAGRNFTKGVAIGIEKGISSFDFRSLANEVVKGFESGLSLGDIEKIIQSYFDVDIPNLKDLAVEAKMMGWEGKPIDGLLEKKLSKFPLSKTFTPVEPPKNDIISYSTPTRLIESNLPSENALASASIRLKQLSNFYAGHKTAFANLQAILTQGIDPTFNQWSLRRDRFDFEKQVFKEPVAYSAINSFSEPIKGNDYYGDAEIMLDIAKIANRSTFTRGDSGAFWRNPSEIITNPLSSFTPDQYNRRPNEILEYLEVQTTGKIDPSDFLGINLGDIEEKYNIYGRKLIEVIASSLSAGVPVFAKNLEAISSMFSSEGRQSGLNYIKGLNIGLQNNNSEKYALDVAIGIIDATNKGLGNASPSWKGKKAGENLIKGVENGVVNESKGLFAKIQNISKKTVDILNTDIKDLGRKKIEMPAEVKEIEQFFAPTGETEEEKYKKQKIATLSETLPEFKKDTSQSIRYLLSDFVDVPIDKQFAAIYKKIESVLESAQKIGNLSKQTEFLQKELMFLDFYPKDYKSMRAKLPSSEYGKRFEENKRVEASQSLFGDNYWELKNKIAAKADEENPRQYPTLFGSQYANLLMESAKRQKVIQLYKEEASRLLDLLAVYKRELKIREIESEKSDNSFSIESTYRSSPDLDAVHSIGYDLAHKEDTLNRLVDSLLKDRKTFGGEYDLDNIKRHFKIGDDPLEQQGFNSIAQNVANSIKSIKDAKKIVEIIEKELGMFPVIDRDKLLKLQKNKDIGEGSHNTTNLEHELFVKEAKTLEATIKNLFAKIEDLGKQASKDFQKGLEIGLTASEAEKIAYKTAIEIVDATNKGLGNASPSKKAMKAMRFFYEGLALGARHIRFGLRLETQFDKEVSDFTFFVGMRSKEARKAILQAVKEMGLGRGERLAAINEIQGSMNTGIFASPRAFQVMKRATVIARPKTTREEILDDWNKKRDNIFNAFDSIEEAGVSSGFTNGIVSGLKAVIAQADGFINFLSVGGKALRTLDQELNAATGGMVNLRKGAIAAIGGFALFKGAEFLLRPLFFAIYDIPFRIQQAVTDSLLAFTGLQRIKLNLNLAGVGNVEQSLDALVARADKLGISFKESAIAYSRFKLLTTDSPLQAQADNIFEGFQEALSARQTNTQQQAESFRAIGQIASKAVVSVEEFTQQLSESGGLNDALNVAARSMGLTTAQFYQQASAGNLLVQDVLPRLAAEYKRMSAGGLSLSTETLQSEISRFQNNTEQLQMRLGEKIGVVAYPALQALNAVLSTLNDNLGTVASVGAAGLLSVMGFLGKSVMQFAAAGRLGAVASAAMSASLQTAGVASLSTATAMGRLKVSINLATLAGIGLIKALIIPTAVITGIQFVYNALNAGSEELKQAVRTLEDSKKALDAWQNKTDNSNRKGLTSFLPDMELSGGEKFFNVLTLGIVYNSKWLMSLLELRQGLENIDKSLATGVGNLIEYQKTLSNFSGSKRFSSELQEIRNNLALVRAERTIASAKGNDRSVAEFNRREQDLMKQEQELINKQLGPVGSRITADLQQYEMALASLEQSFKNKDITDIAYIQRKKDLLTIIGQLKKAEQDYLQVLKDQEKEYRKLQVAFDLAIRTRANANFANEGNSLSRSIGLNQQFASGEINEFQFNVKVREESLQTAKERIATLGNSANSISNILNERLSESANKVLSTYFKEDIKQLNVASFGEAIAENLLSPDAIQKIMDQYESDLKDNAALRAILNQAKEYATARRDILNTEKEIQQISREIIVERKKRQIQEKQASRETVKAEQLTNLANKTSSSQNIGYGLEQTKINLASLYNQLALEQEKLVLNVDDPLTVKTAIANITQQIAETELSLRDQQEQIQYYYRNLDRQIIDFNRQIEDYRRQIEDAQLSAFRGNRSLSESYTDLVRELDKNLLNAQNQLLDATDRIRVQQVKNRLLIPGTSDAGKELGDIFLEFVQGQADIASRGRTFQSRTEEIETSYISTLRNIRNLQEQQQDAERSRLRTIEDIKRTQENLNRTLADLIRQTNKELGFIPQSVKDIVTNLNTLPEPIKLINSELVAIPPNIKTSGEDLVKSIEETAEAIRKAKEGLILPAPSNFTPAPVWNGGGFLPPPPPQSSSIPKGLTPRGQELSQHLNNPRVKAFLDVIAYAEGTAKMPNQGYNTLFGHGQFSSFADHPRQRIPFGSTSSSASGRYQIMDFTWNEEKAKLGLKDFSPVSQDLVALSRILMRGGLDELLKGDIRGAINATRKEWASFPGANYPGQGMKRMEDLLKVYDQSLRQYQPNDPRTQSELDALRYDGNPANSGASNRIRQIRRNQGGSPIPSTSTPNPSPSVQQQITNRLPKNIQSVLVQEVGGKTVYSKNAQTPPASPASTIKVIIADLIAKEITSGKLSLKDAIAIKLPLVDPHGQLKANQVKTVEQLVQLMLEKSDNTATNVLIDRLGGLTKATELARKEGYKNTTISRYLNIPGSGTPNISTAQDVTLAMQSLIKNQNPASQLAEQSLRQTRNFKYNNEIGGKIGNNSKVIGNVGLVNINGKEYIVTAYANINGNQLNNRKIITNATNAISQSIKDSTPNPSPARVLTKEETKEGKGGPEFSSPPPIAQLPTLPNQNQDNFWDADLPPVLKDNLINFQSPNLPPVPNLPTGNLDAAADQIRNTETANQNAEEFLRQLEASFLIDTTLDRAIKFGRQQEEEARNLNRTIRDASESVTDLTINSKGYLTVQEEINKSATEVSRQYRSQIESLEDQRRTLLLNADGWQKMSENIKKVVAEQIALGKMPADVAEQFLKNADALAKRAELAKEQVAILDQAIEQLGKNQGVAALEASFRKTRDTVRSIRDRLNDLTVQRMKLENQSRPTLFDDSAILAERISLQKEKEELEDYLEPYKDLPQYADFVANIRSEWEKLAELRLERVALDASPNRGAAESFFSDIREGKGIGSAFSSLGLNIMTKFVEGITKPAIDALTSAIDGFTKPITQAFESLFNSITGPVGNFFTNALNSIFKPVGNIFSSIFGGGGGGGLFNGLLSGITGIFSGGLGGLGSIGSLGSIGASSFASAPASAFSLGTGFSLFSDGGKVGDANVPIEKNIISAFQRERAMSGGRKPRLIVANEDELVLNPKETEAYLEYRNNAPIKNYANGGFVGGKPNYSTTSNNNSSNQSLVINNTNNVTVESRNDMGYSLNQLKERENTQNERTKKRFFG